MIKLSLIALVTAMSLSAYAATSATSEAQSTDSYGTDNRPALLQIAQAEVTPEPAATQPGNPQLEEAVVIVQSYMKVLSESDMDGKTVRDESQLPNSKASIQDSLILLLGATTESETKAMFKNGFMVLAFYQPGVGEIPVAIDQMGPQDKTWQQVVEGDMQQLGATLAKLGY